MQAEVPVDTLKDFHDKPSQTMSPWCDAAFPLVLWESQPAIPEDFQTPMSPGVIMILFTAALIKKHKQAIS